MNPLQVDATLDQGVALLTLHGDVDIATAPTLREQLSARLDEGARVLTVDLSDVPFMDSVGLGVMTGALLRARRRGADLVVVCPPGPVRAVFEITGLLDVFGVVDRRQAVDEAG